MSKNIIKELIPRPEPYNGSVSEKIFVGAIKGCKTIDIKDIFIEKEIQQTIFDNEDDVNHDNETITIKGYFQLSVKNSDKNKNKLDYIIKELEEMKKNSLTPRQLEIVIEKVIDEQVNPRLDNLEQDIKDIKSCSTIANELKIKNMN